jgi:RNA polymerase sigma-70 factor (ECF subfamily)
MEMEQELHLWDLFRQGDRQAFEALFIRFNPVLIKIGRSMTADRLLPEDSAQDVFVDLWNKRQTLPEVQTVKYYLIVCYRRTLMQQLKKVNKMVDFVPETNGEQVQSSEYKLIEEQLQGNRSRQLHHAIDQLPQRQKEIIQLRYMQSMDYDQIGEQMGINYTSSRKLVYKAITNLKKAMGDKATLFLLMHFLIR